MELTDNEKQTLKIFTSEAGTYDVVYKIAKNVLEQKRDMFVRSLSAKKDLPNDEIGAKLRSFDEGVSLVDAIFRDVLSYKETPHTENHNPGR